MATKKKNTPAVDTKTTAATSEPTVKKKRVLSPEHRAKLQAAAKAAREKKKGLVPRENTQTSTTATSPSDPNFVWESEQRKLDRQAQDPFLTNV